MDRYGTFGWICTALIVFLLAGCGSSRPASPATRAPDAGPANPDAGSTGTRPTQGGTVDVVSIPAPSLANNALGEPAKQEIAVYLPPSYQGSSRKYPVVYYLPGMGVRLRSERGYPLVQAGMDRLLASGTIPGMILVTASGYNTLGASLYVNSPLNGSWEAFVARDVVQYVDAHYRTLPTAASRGISGHSMGGFGALNLAMRHPDVFGAVYALSPALFDQHGLADSSMFSSPEVINSVLDIMDAVAKLPAAQAQARFLKAFVQASTPVQMTFAYGAAFAPAPDGKPPYIAYPYRRSAGQLVQDPAIWAQWNNGWGAIDEKLQRYEANLRQLKAIGLEYGKLDENAWIPHGCAYLAQKLTAAGIPNALTTFDGTHYSELAHRIEGAMLPFMATKLALADARP